MTLGGTAGVVTFFSEISQQTLQIYENMAIITDIWQIQILFYMHQQPMVPDHGTQYEENPSSHHGGMHEEGLPDEWTD